jgi:DNA-binding CsgD family transcriptional regulator
MDGITVNDKDFFKNILLSFEKWFGFSHSNFWFCDENNNLKNNPYCLNSEYTLKDYFNYFYDKDPNTPIRNLNRIPIQRVIGNLDIMSPEEYENSVFYNEFMRKYGLYHNLAIFLYHENKILGLIDFSWPKNERLLSLDDKLSLELLSRFLSQKVNEYHYLNEVRSNQNQAAISLFDDGTLSSRELDVLELIQRGVSNKDIADQLFISVNTVKKHVQSLYRKFDVTNRTSLCFKVNNEGVITAMQK